MSMFDNYEKNNYTAYNLTPRKISNTTKRYLRSPIAKYDKFGNIKQFIWSPEDQFNLKFKFGFKIKVFENSIIYNAKGQKPNSHTVGVKGQRIYNSVDGISWVCKGTSKDLVSDGDWIPLTDTDLENLPEWIPIDLKQKKVFLPRTFNSINNLTNTENKNVSTIDNQTYVWEKDEYLTFSKDGNKEIFINQFTESNQLKISIMNFRHEIIYEYLYNTSEVEIPINKKDTPLLVEGQFFINVYLIENDNTFQQYQIDVTIIEDPNKYITSLQENPEIYTFGTTIQPEGTDYYVWESLNGSTIGGNNDYVWIPIIEPQIEYEADWIKLK